MVTCEKNYLTLNGIGMHVYSPLQDLLWACSPSSAMCIFIHRGTRTFGPYRLEDVLHELTNGSLLPTDMATYDGGGNQFVPLATVPRVAGTAAARGVSPHARTSLGCGGWTAATVGLLCVLAAAGSLVTKDDKSPGSNSPQQQSGPSHRTTSPREFGRGLGQELLRHARTDGGTKGMYYFAQSCRAENPTVKTYTDAEFNQFYSGLVDAYVEWQAHGYTVPGQSVLDQ